MDRARPSCFSVQFGGSGLPCRLSSSPRAWFSACTSLQRRCGFLLQMGHQADGRPTLQAKTEQKIELNVEICEGHPGCMESTHSMNAATWRR